MGVVVRPPDLTIGELGLCDGTSARRSQVDTNQPVTDHAVHGPRPGLAHNLAPNSEIDYGMI